MEPCVVRILHPEKKKGKKNREETYQTLKNPAARNSSVNGRTVFLAAGTIPSFAFRHQIELFHWRTIKQTLCTTKTFRADMLAGALSNVSKGFRNKAHNPRC